MCKKLNILMCVLVLCLSFTGCSSGSDSPNESSTEETKLNTSLPEKETITTSGDTPSNEITLSEDFLSKMTEYTSQFTYVKTTQKMTSYSLLNGEKDSEKVVADITIEVDLKNQITLTTVNANFTEDSDTTYFFADDNKNNIYLSKINDGDYIAGDKLESSVDIDYTKVANAFDFVNSMSYDVFPELNTKGYLEDNIYTFTVERDAFETDLTGTDYDSLGKTTVVLTVEKDENDNLIPRSISMDTTFFVGQIEYGVSTTCEYIQYSTNELQFPEYVKVEENKDDTNE